MQTEFSTDAELHVCQDLIRGRIQLSEAALADDHVDLRALNTTRQSDTPA